MCNIIMVHGLVIYEALFETGVDGAAPRSRAPHRYCIALKIFKSSAYDTCTRIEDKAVYHPFK